MPHNGQCCKAQRVTQTLSMVKKKIKSYHQSSKLSCGISPEKHTNGNMGRNQCSASFLPLAELLVSSECVNKMFRLHLAALT